jgi:hypothetical protein
MTGPEPLHYNQYYHIHNRGNNGEPLFREQRNYPYMLKLYARYIAPAAETYAYCLMSHHFHLLVRIKSFEQCKEVCQSFKDWQTYSHVYPSRAFANLFGTYTKAFNKTYQRTGALFESPFHRTRVSSDRYYTALVAYIHRHPQQHGFAADCRGWPYSSYRAILSDVPTRVQREAVLDWFCGRVGFEELHRTEADEATIKSLVGDDCA